MALQNGSIRRMIKREKKDLERTMVVKRAGTRKRTREDGECVCGEVQVVEEEIESNKKNNIMKYAPPLPLPGLHINRCGL